MKTLLAPCELDLIEHYADPAERTADKWVHLIGLGLAIVGGVVLFTSSFVTGGVGRATAIALYAVCLISMLAASTAYNLSDICKARPLLRRMDEAAIFLMIAGSYTPFTVLRFEGWQSVAATTAVWTLALTGVAMKLFLPVLSDKFWTAVYVGFGWLAVIMIEPLVRGIGATGMFWLALGGLIYTAGTLFFLNPKLRFRRAVWHGFVVTAATVHWFAILAFVGLAPA